MKTFRRANVIRAYQSDRFGNKSAAQGRFVFLVSQKINQEVTMARGSKKKYTSKQIRKAEHIEEGYEKRGVSKKEAESRAWATVNKSDKGGKKSGSGRGKKSSKASSRKGGRKGGKKSGGKKKR
jgi:plasmid stabilization system protein ParE